MQFKVFLTHTIGERVYNFFCDQVSPTTEVKEALAVFHTSMCKIEEAAKLKQESTETQEKEAT